MDAKIGIKEEDPLSNDLVSHNKGEFITEYVTMKTNSDAVIVGDVCDVTIKSETPDYSQTERESYTIHNLNQITSDTVTCSSNCDIGTETEIEEQILGLDFGPQNGIEFVPEDPVIRDKKYTSHERNNKMEIKVEPWWVETDDFKDGDFPAVRPSRLCKKAVSSDSNGKSLLHSAENSGRKNRKDCAKCESQKSGATRIPTAEECVHSEQCDKYSDGVDINSKALYFKQKNLNNEGKRQHIYRKNRTNVLHLKSNSLNQDCERPFHCSYCGKSFSVVKQLKLHTLSHEGKRPQQCKICKKLFTQWSNLKKHQLIHEGKRPHECKTCGKSFIQLSHLQSHTLIHEGKKPYQCKTCGKRFTQLSHVNSHNLIHEGKKPYNCKTCDKSFTNLTSLNMHNLIHEGRKPHQCKTCNKSFTQLANLRKHTLIHEGKKPYQCKTCEKWFNNLSNLYTHRLIHEGKKPHKCETCGRCFTKSSNLKMHFYVHEGKKPHPCKNCDKSFITMSKLRRHINLMHGGKKPH